jgi:glutathione synthase/RimK-type ligase-like ATP-grasp enzyme
VDVVFATCDDRPLVAPDDEPLVAELGALGIRVTPIPWTEIDPYAVVTPEPIVLRSTWDYHRVPTMFAAWLEALEFSGRVVMNSPRIARENIDKIYLRRLSDVGIPMPRTRWIDRPDSAAISRVLTEERWDAAVLKPRIGATAHGLSLVASGIDVSDADLGPARQTGALVQEFVPEIRTRGEVSLVFLDGCDFSHAVSKYARDGDFRVQSDFGGRVIETTPSDDVLALARMVMLTVPDECVFARVDIVEADRGPLLMELELIEPELYFTVVPDSASRTAAMIDVLVRALT